MQLPILLDRESSNPLQDQLFTQLQQLIVSRTLKPNSRIVATRFLAEYVGVSRTTVLLVYERLISEGYLTTQPTIGTFVSEVLPDIEIHKRSVIPPQNAEIPRQANARPAVFGSLAPPPALGPSLRYDFCRSIPGGELLPSKIWLRLTQRVFEQHAAGIAELPPPEGLPILRQALAEWLGVQRGMAVAPEQIVVVSGLRQAYAIVSHLFQRRGDRVVVEDPGNETVAHFLGSRGADLVPVAVDDQGLIVEQLPQGPVSLACVTPARQDPIGGTMPLRRREALIAWALQTGAYVIEDEFACAIRYQGSAPAPLVALDQHGLVFHVGSFSKTLGAGLCLGYIVAPPEFAKAVAAIKAMSDDGSPWIEQMVLADFISTGGYDQHLRRLRRTFMIRRDELIRTLEKSFRTGAPGRDRVRHAIDLVLVGRVALSRRHQGVGAPTRGGCLRPIVRRVFEWECAYHTGARSGRPRTGVELRCDDRMAD